MEISIKRIKALVVEDEKIFQEQFQIGLDESNFEIKFAANGIEALQLYEEWRPDIIILDIMLPMMTGYSVLKKIRSEFSDREVTIVMVTSLGTREDVEECLKWGIQGYIVKPFDYRTIESRITAIYNKSMSFQL